MLGFDIRAPSEAHIRPFDHPQLNLHSKILPIKIPLTIQFAFQPSPSTQRIPNSIYFPILSHYTKHFLFNLHCNTFTLHNPLPIQFKFHNSPYKTHSQFNLQSKPIRLHNPPSIHFTFQNSPSTQPTN